MVCCLCTFTINRYKRDGSSEVAVMETGFKYVIEFCNNTIETFWVGNIITIFGMAKQ